MYHSRKIGVFISHIFGDYQNNVCQGIADRAMEHGYATEIFASADGEDFGSYGNGEKSILRIPHFEDFSGVVFASGTYLQKELRQQIGQTLRDRCSCPVLEIAQHDTSFPRLKLGNGLCAANLTVHLIREHHCRRICYLGCSLERASSDPRRALCAQVMEQHGLPFAEEDTADCEYTRDSIHAAIAAFLAAPKKPDAIVCYNDRMAVIVMEFLLKQGLRIPEDICVTGFDDLTVSKNCSPDLTTVTFPLYETGCRAFDLLHACILGKAPLPEETVVPSEPVYRGSCCADKKHALPNPLFYENHLLRKVENRENAMLSDIKLSATLHAVKDLDDGMDLLEDFVASIEDCREFYLCLYPGWDHIPGKIRRIASMPDAYEDEDQIRLAFAFRNGVRLPECRFSTKSILPDYLSGQANSFFVYFPLFYGEREFGYAAMSFESGKISASFSLLLFLRNINSMLERIFEQRQTGVLVHRLEDISGRDELTRLPDRSGFRFTANQLLAEAAREHKKVVAMQFVVSDMQSIRERYGRTERDFAICVAGHALESCLPGENAALSHQGGGEFLLLVIVDDEDTVNQADLITQRTDSYLDHYNLLHTKPYEIHVSATGRTVRATDSVSLEDLYS
ncbi:MAG: substrate-binding domain-containing protein [Lachnospiraceae bacterium]|nr:substrate-binding domain-containing protein [Lachnospiraceae bacterium]